MIKKIFISLLFFIIIFSCGYKKPYQYVIEAGKDAQFHNNVGLRHFRDRAYYAAIQEFKIAISLSPSSQASAVYYNNLGETYNFIGYPDLAEGCFNDAIRLYGLNFKYYLNLVETYDKLNLIDIKIRELTSSEDAFDRIKLGLLYIQRRDFRIGVNILDEFCYKEPDLIITPAIKQYIDKIAKENL